MVPHLEEGHAEIYELLLHILLRAARRIMCGKLLERAASPEDVSDERLRT